jgi:hypothetical protein
MTPYGHLERPVCKPARRAGTATKIACLLICWLLTAFHLSARAPAEYEVKAAFLFNFVKFVEWPTNVFPSDNKSIVIGIVGDDPFGEAFTAIVKEQTAQGRKVEIQHYKANEDFNDCHLLFVTRSVAGQTEDILQRIRGRPILTVGENEDFLRQGGIIGFALVQKTVRFDINPKAAEQVGLKASSKLLAVARSIVHSP